MKKYAFLTAALVASLVSACSDGGDLIIPPHGSEMGNTPDPKPGECSDKCSREKVECESEDVIYRCEDTNDDGCLDVVRENCPIGKICKAGKCVKENIPSDQECGGDVDCKDGRICVDGHCVEESIPSDQECGGDVDCKDGRICVDGHCVESTESCEDECSGNAQCVGEDGYKTCGDFDSDGCTEWSTVQKCDPGAVCSDGVCKTPQATCKDTCSGTTVCEGTTGYKTCKDTNNDGCKEWTAVTKCGSGMTCKNGACQAAEPVCKDTCSGTTVCEGTTGYKTCKDTNGDGCKEWTAVTKCGSGESCSGGKCAAPVCKYTSVTAPSIHPLPSEAKAGTSESVTTGSFTDEYLYDASNYLKIGARREWGGSIIFFGIGDGKKGTNGTNTIDGNDTGREVQVAIYDGSRQMQNCAHNASCGSVATACPGSITYLGWNPVQGGNRCNIGSGVDSVNNKNGIMEIVTTPLHWNPNWDATDCTSNGCSTSLKNRKSDVRLTQRLRFVRTHVVELFYSVQNLSDLSHTNSAQELPTLYAAYGAHGLGNYHRLMNADKTEIAINEPANDGFFTKAFTSSEPWVTLQNSDLSYGVGILYENGLLKYQGWQKANVFNNVRSLLYFALPPRGTVNARAYLILGNFDTVKSEARWLMSNLPPFGTLDVPAEGHAVSGSVDVSGWALDNKKVAKVEARIDETTTELAYGSDRADVCKVWIGYPSCNKVGFSGKIDVSKLDKNCKHLLEIIATDSDGNKRTIANRLLTVH